MLLQIRRNLILTTVAMATAVCLGQVAAVPNSQRQEAIALEQQGNNVEAEAAWRAFLKIHPSNSEAYAHLGLLEARQEHYKEAVPLYRKALALNPTFPELRLNLGLALFKAGEMKQAIQVFQPLLKSQSPASAETQRVTILLGMAHYGLGEFAEAAPYLRQAAVRDPQNLGLRMSLAHSCLWSKQYQCVLDTYHEILMLNAESAEADILASEALDEMKDHQGAIKQSSSSSSQSQGARVHSAWATCCGPNGSMRKPLRNFRTNLPTTRTVFSPWSIWLTPKANERSEAALPLLE